MSPTIKRANTRRNADDGPLANETLLNATEAAKFLHLSDHQLRYKVKHRLIPHVRIGGTLRFRKSEIATWVEHVPAVQKEDGRGKWKREKTKKR